MNLVLDGSAALAALLPDEKGGRAGVAIEETIAKADVLRVPAHWWVEVVNGVLMAEKRGRITAFEIREVLSITQDMKISVDGETPLRIPGDALMLARVHKLTIYDAAYLELAMRSGATLATLDSALHKAAVVCGVRTVPEKI